MPIRGTKYQTFEWEGIKKKLIKAGMATFGDPETPNALLMELINSTSIQQSLIKQWSIELQQELGKAYQNNSLDITENLGGAEYNDSVSSAIELTEIFGIESKRIKKLLINVLQAVQKNKTQTQWKSHCYKSLSDFFSELRYIKDAENIAISTGLSTSAQHVQILAKIEELNRKVEKAFADKDLLTIAELNNSNLDTLESNPFLINRYKSKSSRPALIIAADKVFRARNDKQPQLPTKKFNNLVNPDIIQSLLNELEATETISLNGFNKTENSEYDWLETFVSVVNGSEPSSNVYQEQQIDTTNNFWDSPDMEITAQSHSNTSDVNNDCLSVVKPTYKLGLILKLDKNNDILNLLSAEELAILQGQKLSKATLAKLVGQTVYKFEQVVEKVLQDYIICMKKSIPLLNAREL